MRMNFIPLGERVLVEMEETQHVTKSGIIIPTAALEKNRIGRVVAVGEECGRLVEGDRVLTGKYSGSDISVGGREYSLFNESDIFGYVKEVEDDSGSNDGDDQGRAECESDALQDTADAG